MLIDTVGNVVVDNVENNGKGTVGKVVDDGNATEDVAAVETANMDR